MERMTLRKFILPVIAATCLSTSASLGGMLLTDAQAHRPGCEGSFEKEMACLNLYETWVNKRFHKDTIKEPYRCGEMGTIALDWKTRCDTYPVEGPTARGYGLHSYRVKIIWWEIKWLPTPKKIACGTFDKEYTHGILINVHNGHWRRGPMTCVK